MYHTNAEKAIPSLHHVFKDYFSIGAAVTPQTIETQGALLKKHYNSLTAENVMKFENLQPKEGVFTFGDADKIMTFAEKNNMKMRGHTLIWHNQTPSWVFKNEDGSAVGRNQLLKRMENHITTVMNHYKGRIYSWDVLNEAITDEEGYLRKTDWLEIIGEDFIAKAFEFAHKADENAVLFYNDYNECFPEKREKIYRLVKSLVEKEVPIHGVGLQAHWNVADPELENIRAAIERYASLGMEIQITEMDVSVFEWNNKRTDLSEPTEEMLLKQQERYEHFFQIFRDYKDVITNVTFWGAADDHTWLNDFPVKGRKNWPFLFDEQHEPKKAFWSIVNI